MKLKKFLTGWILTLLWISTVFGAVTTKYQVANIINFGSAISSINPTTTRMMLQEGFIQHNMLVSDFANNISGGYVSYVDSHSGEYFNIYSGIYFRINSGVYFNTNSGNYYNTNPRGYITGGLYISITSLGINITGTTNFLQPIWFIGSGITWDDIQNAQRNLGSTTSQQPAQLNLDGTTLPWRCFTGLTQMQEIYGSVEIPHNALVGTSAVLSPHFHWMGSTTEATTGRVTMEYWLMHIGSIFPVTGSTGTLTMTTKGITGWIYRMDDFGTQDISISGYTIGDTLSYRIYRDPTGVDTYTGNICFVQVGFHYMIDAMGSRTEYTK